MPFPIDPRCIEPEARPEYEHGSFMSAMAISQAVSLKRIADAICEMIAIEEVSGELPILPKVGD